MGEAFEEDAYPPLSAVNRSHAMSNRRLNVRNFPFLEFSPGPFLKYFRPPKPGDTARVFLTLVGGRLQALAPYRNSYS